MTPQPNADELLEQAQQNLAAAVKGVRSVQDRAAVANTQAGLAQALMVRDQFAWERVQRVAAEGRDRQWLLERMRDAYDDGRDAPRTLTGEQRDARLVELLEQALS